MYILKQITIYSINEIDIDYILCYYTGIVDFMHAPCGITSGLLGIQEAEDRKKEICLA